jgi:ribosomal protein S18 acetylase RimI-like enzyme
MLDNVVWHALGTTQHDVADELDGARRYQREVSPFYGVDVVDEGGWRALADLAGPGHVVVLFRDEVPPPPDGWQPLMDAKGNQMVADGPLERAPAVAVRPLESDDVPQMMELVGLTRPGPFLSRTIELGGYVGAFEGNRLVAMAGERMRVPGYAEVSAVCTHPEARGRGLAAALTTHVANGIRTRGETPFLHVAVGNDGAKRVYERLGFRVRRQVDVVVVRTPDGTPDREGSS